MRLIFFSAENHQLVGTKEKLIAAWRVVYSDRVRLELRAHLQSFCPDVVHVHNFFPLLTPSVYDACIEKNIPVVQTLHNYRIICPNALFLRNGKVCEDCLGRGPFPAVVHACYRGSRLATLPVALMVAVHRHRRTWERKVDRIIALSAFAKNKFLEGGLPAEKIVVKPNFAPDPDVRGDFIRRKNALFVGRLGEEKGISVLIKAWKELDYPLRIVGDGPFTGRAREVLNPAISWLGSVSPAEVSLEMERAAFLVLPSVCYEGFPLTLVEAFSHRLPVVASCLGSLADLVKDGVTGLLFSPGDADDLVTKIRWMMENPEKSARMGENARREYEEKYTPERNYRLLMDIYREVMDEKKTDSQYPR